DLQGLRRGDRCARRPVRHVPDAPSPRLLGVHRCLLDLRLQRKTERPRMMRAASRERSGKGAASLSYFGAAVERLSCWKSRRPKRTDRIPAANTQYRAVANEWDAEEVS